MRSLPRFFLGIIRVIQSILCSNGLSRSRGEIINCILAPVSNKNSRTRNFTLPTAKAVNSTSIIYTLFIPFLQNSNNIETFRPCANLSIIKKNKMNRKLKKNSLSKLYSRFPNSNLPSNFQERSYITLTSDF